jgi:hypothetical protein
MRSEDTGCRAGGTASYEDGLVRWIRYHLREETEFRPKPMVEIGGRPILWHIMKMYVHYGMHEFILCLGYRGNMINDYFLKYEAMNSDFRICLGRQSHVEFMGAHHEQDFAVILADTCLETMTGWPLAARCPLSRERYVSVHERRLECPRNFLTAAINSALRPRDG